MTWEEDTLVEKLRDVLRTRADVVSREAEERRGRTERMRYFLMAWGATHWPDRVGRGAPTWPSAGASPSRERPA
jgi:hypothetical protein